MRVTALERQKRGKRLNLHLDHSFAIAISPEVMLQFGLRVGHEVNKARLQEIREAEARQAALQSGLRLLSHRPRSEAELRNRLLRKRMAAKVVEETIGRLHSLGLMDDEAFARSWVESRDRTNPRSRRLIGSELRAKGIDRATADRSLSALDDADAAYRAAARRARSLAGLAGADFRRRLGDFLLRRGFDYEVVRATVGRLWQEVSEQRPPAEDDRGSY